MENTNKINVFNEFKPYLRFLKVYNHQNSHSRDWRSTLRRIFDALCTTLVILLTVCFALLTTWCLCENEVNLDKIVVAAPVIATISQIAFFGISLVLKSETMDGMIRRIQAMVDRRCSKSNESHRIYRDSEAKHALITMRMLKISVTYVILSYLASAMFPISHAIFGSPPSHQWILPIETHSLIGRDNYTGFFIDWCSQMTFALACYFVVVPCVSIYIGAFIYVHSLVKDLKMRMAAIDANFSNEPCHRSNKWEKWTIYVNEIDFHVEIIGVVYTISNMMEMILFSITFTCVIAIAFNLFIFESIETLSLELTVAFGNIIVVVAITFAYFFFAEWITSDLLEIGDNFYDSPWYCLPTKQQKLLVLPIQRAQHELRLTGFGFFDGSLLVFSAIIRSAASYFLMIRSFG